ncbi:MAG TPA: D-alanyl-D-alanine carboxypeptidase/D-alanyl-D-alanine-endopeptidase [Burkholderiales bacterium]|nr:D-alanyl-D-alanine carboxypeptidase/D-alanyl-D-alanine-endopeptidase [Burkholderiales bacterium]
MNRFLSGCLVLFICVCAIPALAADESHLPTFLKLRLDSLNVSPQDVHIFVKGVDADHPLLSDGASEAVSPASTMKLVTTYAALQLLGPADVFHTEVYVRGTVKDGVLHGDLVFQGGGDPDLTLERFWLMLRAIRRAGIRTILGNLILDDSYYSLPAYDPGAFDGYPYEVYNTGPNALLVNFDASRFYLEPSDQGVKITADPPMSLIQVVNQIKLVGGNCNDYGNNLDIKVLAVHPRVRVRLEGPYAVQCGKQVVNYRILDNTSYVGALFSSIWAELGGKFLGHVQKGTVRAEDERILDWKSRPLAAIVRDMNKFSNNVMARNLFLDLSTTNPADLASARKVVRDFLVGSGLDFPELVIVNGSGLSRKARISAEHLGELLESAWHSPVMPEFVASLPLLGRDGTLRKRLRNGPEAGMGHIKTGTLDNTDAIAGYLEDARGGRWVVVCIVDNTSEAKAKVIEDALLKWVYKPPLKSVIQSRSNEGHRASIL